MKRIEVEFEGSSPLFMNRMSLEQLELLRTKKRAKFVAPKDPRDEADPKVYRTEDGKPYLPTENFVSCLIAAGLYIKLDGKRQMTTSKSTLLPGFMTVENPFLMLTNGNGNGHAPTWEVDMRQGRNPNGGQAICIVRPRFDRWGFKAVMLMDDEQIAEDRIRELVDIAGSRIGLGDFRPQRKGIYGKFRVVSWKTKV